MNIKIYESTDLINDFNQDNLWVLDIGRSEPPESVHYDDVISTSFYPIATKVPALLGKIAKWVKETTGEEWNWDYTVYVKDRESLKTTGENVSGYIVPYNKIREI